MSIQNAKKMKSQSAASVFLDGMKNASAEMKILEIDKGYVIVAFKCGCHALMWQDWDEAWWLGANPTYCFLHHE